MPTKKHKTTRKKVVKKNLKMKKVTYSKNRPFFSFLRKPKRGWRRLAFSFLRTSAVVLVLALGATLISYDPSVLNFMSAGIPEVSDSKFQPRISYPSDQSVRGQIPNSQEGLLIAVNKEGENEKKLIDIFAGVFPDKELRVIPYDSAEGKRYVADLSLLDLPTVVYKKSLFDAEPLSATVKDLFIVQGNFEVLNAALVNPSGQLHLGSMSQDSSTLTIGPANAPLTVIIYSSLDCQDCRVHERNTFGSWKNLAKEGRVRVEFRDLDSLLACSVIHQKDPNASLALRETLYARANLTKEYREYALKKNNVEDLRQCEAQDFPPLLDKRLSDALSLGGATLPVVFVGKTGGNQWTRFTAVKEFSEYEKAGVSF